MDELLMLLHRLAWRLRCLDLRLVGISLWNPISEPSWTYWLKNFLTKCWCLQPVHSGLPCKMQTWRMNASANNLNNCENGTTASTWSFAGKFIWSNSVKEDVLTWSSQHLHFHGGPVLSKTFQDIELAFINVNMAVYVKTTMVCGDLCAKTPPFWLPRLLWHRPWICYVLEITNIAVLKGTWKASELWRLPSWRTTNLRWLPHWLLLWPHLRLHIPGTLDLQSRRSRSMLARWSTCMSRAKLKPCGLSKSSTATLAILQPSLWLSCFKAAMPVKQWAKLQVPMFALLANDTANPISLHLQTSLMSSASTRRFNPTSFGSKMARWSTPFCPTSTWPPSTRQQLCCGRKRPMTSSLVLKGLGLPTLGHLPLWWPMKDVDGWVIRWASGLMPIQSFMKLPLEKLTPGWTLLKGAMLCWGKALRCTWWTWTCMGPMDFERPWRTSSLSSMPSLRCLALALLNGFLDFSPPLATSWLQTRSLQHIFQAVLLLNKLFTVEMWQKLPFFRQTQIKGWDELCCGAMPARTYLWLLARLAFSGVTLVRAIWWRYVGKVLQKFWWWKLMVMANHHATGFATRLNWFAVLHIIADQISTR